MALGKVDGKISDPKDLQLAIDGHRYLNTNEKSRLW
jgi:hypothetical protein